MSFENDTVQSDKPLSPRRENRVVAVQFLYSWDLNRPEVLAHDVGNYLRGQPQKKAHYDFAEELIYGTLEHVDEVDAKIVEKLQNWAFNRIAKVDLAILRVGVYELLYRKDIPPVVTINEALEVGKLLSGPDSKRFLNGILDKVALELKRPQREPQGK